jgi:hypothetical protein
LIAKPITVIAWIRIKDKSNEDAGKTRNKQIAVDASAPPHQPSSHATQKAKIDRVAKGKACMDQSNEASRIGSQTLTRAYTINLGNRASS